MERDVFDWDEQPGQSKEYDVSKKQHPGLDLERTKELLKLANTHLNAGEVLDASALLKQVRPQLVRHATLRDTFEWLANTIDARKSSIRDRCKELAGAGDSDRLITLLAGQASNEMEPEEVCAVALDAAKTLLRSRRADGAAELLRLAPFRTVREQELVQSHRELELKVHRVRSRQHTLKSFLFLGSVIAAGAIALSIFALLVWHGGMVLTLWILAPVSLVAVVFMACGPQMRDWFQSWTGQRSGRSRSAEKLADFLKERRK
jgi:hypothetical protein